jgi:hypothetical protein
VEFWFNGALKEWVLDTVKEQKQKDELILAYKSGGADANLVRDTWLNVNINLMK